jgi:hypothetical protein
LNTDSRKTKDDAGKSALNSRKAESGGTVCVHDSDAECDRSAWEARVAERDRKKRK